MAAEAAAGAQGQPQQQQQQQGGGGPQAAPSIVSTVVNAVIMYLLITNGINFLYKQSNGSNDTGGSGNDQSEDGEGAVGRPRSRSEMKLPPYPAWRVGTLGSVELSFTLGNTSDAVELPVNVSFVTTLLGAEKGEYEQCTVPMEDALYSMEPNEPRPPQDEDGKGGELVVKLSAGRGSTVGPFMVNTSVDGSDVFFHPAVLRHLQSMGPSSNLKTAAKLRPCAATGLQVNFTGLDLTAAVESNTTVFLRVRLTPVTTIGPSAVQYFALTQFRNVRPKRRKQMLLDNAVARQSAKYAVDQKALTDVDGNVEEEDTSVAKAAKDLTEAEEVAVAVAGDTAAGDGDDEPQAKTRMYVSPTCPIGFVPEPVAIQSLPPPVQDLYIRTSAGYLPLLFKHDFWVLGSSLQEVNETTAATVMQNFTVTFETMGQFKMTLYRMYAQQLQNQVDMGLAGPDEADIQKSIFLDNSPWYLGLCVAVSLLRVVFEYLAFKNDVQFWRGRKGKDLKGLSLRAVAMNCYFQLIIFLYLIDDGETSWAVTVPSGIGVLIEFWKLFKCVRIEWDPVTKRPTKVEWNWAEEDETNQHDRTAGRWMYRLGAPCLVAYTVYSMLYEEHAGWWSFLIRTQVRFIYYAGFVMMCPQIFINYKMKSVAAMPWKSFVYKALNTVVDDLFAFVISMPWLHRLACFRDDVVFLILLYQRWIYRVDPTRVNEFGQRGDGKAPDAEDDGKSTSASPSVSRAASPESAAQQAAVKAVADARTSAATKPRDADSKDAVAKKTD